jgi:hypothetical protein
MDYNPEALVFIGIAPSGFGKTTALTQLSEEYGMLAPDDEVYGYHPREDPSGWRHHAGLVNGFIEKVMIRQAIDDTLKRRLVLLAMSNNVWPLFSSLARRYKLPLHGFAISKETMLERIEKRGRNKEKSASWVPGHVKWFNTQCRKYGAIVHDADDWTTDQVVDFIRSTMISAGEPVKLEEKENKNEEQGVDL